MTLPRGFEIYYFDGRGNRVGPLDFETFMNILGELDADEPKGGTDHSLHGGTTDCPSQYDLFDRESEEPSDPRVSKATQEGAE